MTVLRYRILMLAPLCWRIPMFLDIFFLFLLTAGSFYCSNLSWTPTLGPFHTSSATWKWFFFSATKSIACGILRSMDPQVASRSDQSGSGRDYFEVVATWSRTYMNGAHWKSWSMTCHATLQSQVAGQVTRVKGALKLHQPLHPNCWRLWF